ncbi:hypothetical protein PGTUg99_005368 [Puccinia graminis f. sp. tritici]|uniref:Uncharacterized protein n=1 Tax=Puccinia graminis f. sp. tritici TaxID=56615 RepID=A0A5B0MY40_PUCGR|nr:hypothetical protein PGTUg99_001871 [Puccinia graminis f. sp. tritici]KAA1134511.1 hypothetical protein PGTUg99_005368 [Puccinia graminis f. sp. tritici]
MDAELSCLNTPTACRSSSSHHPPSSSFSLPPHPLPPTPSLNPQVAHKKPVLVASTNKSYIGGFPPSHNSGGAVVGTMRVVYDIYSPICPIGAPSRDNTRPTRNLNPAVAKVAPPPPPPPPTAARVDRRRQGIVFNVQDLPLELKALQANSSSPNPARPA